MQTPLEITFHGLEPSESLEAAIRQQVEKLDRHHEFVSCHVTLEKSSAKGQPHHHVGVHIQINLRGHTLEVSRDPHHERENRAHTDEHAAVHDAFKVAERQLKDWREKNRTANRVERAEE